MNGSKEVRREAISVVSTIGPGLRVIGDCISDGIIRIDGRVEGGIPVAVTVMPFSSSLLERPIDLSVEVKDGNLGLLADIFPRLKECEGR